MRATVDDVISLAAQRHQAGLAAHQMGCFDEAVTAFRQALSLNPQSAAYHASLGAAYEAMGQIDDAAACYRAGLSINPVLAEATHGLGTIYERQGKLEDALACYRQIVKDHPDSAQAYSVVGFDFARHGRFDEAISYYQQALRLAPNYADAHCNLGNVLLRQDRFDEAIDCYSRALTSQPQNAEAHNSLGFAYERQNRLEHAIHCYRQALQWRPRFAEAHCNLGNALLRQRRLDEAVACYRLAVQCNPNFIDAFNNLANALEQQNKLDEALECYGIAIQLDHQCVQAHFNKGVVLERQDRLNEAIRSYWQAIRLKSNFAEAYFNLGNAYAKQDCFRKAIRCYRRVLQLRPNYAEVYSNLGSALYCLNRLDEADASIEKALLLEPELASAHRHRSLLWLVQGDFVRGWREYEWRWTQPDLSRRHQDKPLWDGSNLAGRRVLLYWEQGLGDTLHFIRYAPFVKALGGTVVLESQKPLLKLLAKARGIDQLVPDGKPLPPFDCQVPVASLPNIFRTTQANVPAAVPYLFPPGDLVEHWRAELASLEGMKIGIVWHGSNAPLRFYRRRTIPLVDFAPIADVKNVQLISLQKGVGTDQLAALQSRFPVLDLASRLDEASGPFMDTAAVMKNLDLVICCDTAIAHLAGALGVAVWVAVPFVPDWRWMVEREDTPWYPTMRLFRQRRHGHWEDVFERMAQQLKYL